MNRISLLGRLAKDPEVRYTQASNKMVTSFSLAVNRRYKKQGEESTADFIPVVVWGKQAEFCSSHLQKGQQIAIEGRLQQRVWEDEQNKKHYVLEVILEQLFFADTKKQDNGEVSEFASANDFTPDDNSELPF